MKTIPSVYATTETAMPNNETQGKYFLITSIM